MEETKTTPNTPKPSIFTCKTCKVNEIKQTRVKKTDADIVSVKLQPAKETNQDAKYIVKIQSKSVSFGARGYSDFT